MKEAERINVDPDPIFGERFVYRVNAARAIEIGEARQRGHASNSSVRFRLNPNHENILGVKSEMAFSEYSGLPMDYSIRPLGDGGIDFRFNAGKRPLTIDAKGAAIPRFLFLKQKEAERASDILVLGGVDGEEVELLGWEHKSMMRLMPLMTIERYGIVNHYRPRAELRPIRQLLNLIHLPAKW